MRQVTLDFETYYDGDYSLSKLTTEGYVRDPRFEALILGYQIDGGTPCTAVGEEIPDALAALRLEECAVLMHHAHFDALILKHHFGVRPKVVLDTLSMARAAVGTLVSRSLSLDALATHFGLGAKGKEVLDAKGKHLADFAPRELANYCRYCANDVALTHALGQRLLPQFALSELRLIDLMVRLFSEPLLELDAVLLQEYKDSEVAHKAGLMLRAGVERADLMSNEKFAALLRRFGVEPEMKTSARTGKETYAFAKTDEAMTALLEHPDDMVRVLAEARLGVKTTLAETRAQRFIDMSLRGAAAVYLSYWGAEQTGRASGRDGTNWQNMGRAQSLEPELISEGATVVTPSGRGVVQDIRDDVLVTHHREWPIKACHKLGLRDGVRSPEGYTLVVGDSANIEARMLAYLAGQDDVVEKYRAGEDLYCYLATEVFGRPISKADKTERMLGKVATLGLGYSMGTDKFIDTVRRWRIEVPPATAARAVETFRSKYARVAAWWRHLQQQVLPAMAEGRRVAADLRGIVATGKDCLHLPNGRVLRYPKLRFDAADGKYGSWRYDVRKGAQVEATRAYGGRLAENITQALARVVVMDQAVTIGRRHRVVLLVHDEVVCCVPVQDMQACRDDVLACLRTTPAWAPGLPLDAEVATGEIYGTCK